MRGGETGAVVYRGPSLLTGDEIVVVVTGLDTGSMNKKTGAMAQAWILRTDRPPMDAVRDESDAAICGSCALRGEGAFGRRCYVVVWFSPTNVYKRFIRGDYVTTTWVEAQALLEGRSIRLGAYGDLAAAPFELWRTLLATTSTWTAYTHAWRLCDPRLKTIAMASVDTVDEFHAAHLGGWRTFRIRDRHAPLVASHQQCLEFVCPASDEAQHRTTCDRCGLCRGTSSPARSVAIYPHGFMGAIANFHRSRTEALADAI